MQDDGFSVRLPTDPEYAGVAFHRPYGASADVSKLRVTYKCYAQVNVTGVIDEEEEQEDITGLAVHRCKVPDKANYRGSGTFAHNFGKDDCTNGKPVGDCDAMFSKAAHDHGENEGYMAFPPVRLFVRARAGACVCFGLLSSVFFTFSPSETSSIERYSLV